jgi:hypothetical protein
MRQSLLSETLWCAVFRDAHRDHDTCTVYGHSRSCHSSPVLAGSGMGSGHLQVWNETELLKTKPLQHLDTCHLDTCHLDTCRFKTRQNCWRQNLCNIWTPVIWTPAGLKQDKTVEDQTFASFSISYMKTMRKDHTQGSSTTPTLWSLSETESRFSKS